MRKLLALVCAVITGLWVVFPDPILGELDDGMVFLIFLRCLSELGINLDWLIRKKAPSNKKELKEGGS